MRPDHTAGPQAFLSRLLSGDMTFPPDIDWVVMYRLLSGDPVHPTTVSEFRAVLRFAQGEGWTGDKLSRALGCGLGSAQTFLRTDPDTIDTLPRRRVGKAYVEWKRRGDLFTNPVEVGA